MIGNIIAAFNSEGPPVGSGIVATGGTVVTSGVYTYHTFTANGTFTVTTGGSGLEMLVIGGGGAGG